MKRKGKKTFRGTPEQHLKEASEAAEVVRFQTKAATAALKRDDCAAAYSKIQLLLLGSGRYMAHRIESGKGARGRAAKSVNRINAMFIRKCLR